jgi:hypothetical protein
MYKKPIPNITRLQEFAKRTGPFPTSAALMAINAKALSTDHDIVEFINQFYPDVTFLSREDFVTRCQDLGMLIREELETPREVVRSPQD